MSTHVTFDDGATPVLHFARRYPHPVEHVWAALTEPAQLSRWFPCEVHVDLRLGGTLILTFSEDEQDTAEIIELDPPRALAFVWAGERLRWTLQADGDGCVLRLSNTVLDREWTPRTAAGWDRCFEALAAHFDRTTPDAPAPATTDTAATATTAGPEPALVAHYRAVLTPAADA